MLFKLDKYVIHFYFLLLSGRREYCNRKKFLSLVFEWRMLKDPQIREIMGLSELSYGKEQKTKHPMNENKTIYKKACYNQIPLKQ